MSDPVVSPADTIRRHRDDLQFALVPLGRDCATEILTALNALLAVGERDKAEIEALRKELRELTDAGYDHVSGIDQQGDLDAAVQKAARVLSDLPPEWYAAADAVLAGESPGERDRQQIARLTEALERLEPVQQRVLGMIERNGFVFRTPLDKPDNERTEAERWEKLALTLYSELCEADSVVRAVLADEEDARP